MTEKTFSLKEIASHNKKDNCWLIIHGNVLDVTKFLSEHPGSEKPLLENAGRDATDNFEKTGHSENARQLMTKYKIGVIEGVCSIKGGCAV